MNDNQTTDVKQERLATLWHIYAALRRYENDFPQEVTAGFIAERRAAHKRFEEAFK